MKSSITFLLVILSVISYAYASWFPDFISIWKEMQKLEECENYASNCERYSRDTFFIQGKLLLMAIEREKTVTEYPLLGTFQSEGKCVRTRLFFYDFMLETFVVSEYKCENQIVNIEGVNGEYLLRIKDTEEMRKKLKGKKIESVESKFSFNYETQSLEKISSCPSILKSFDSKIIPENFNVETDQKYEKGHNLVHRGFYLVKSRKGAKEDSENDLTYALFSSKTLSYAVPIQSGCKCTLEGTKLLVCVCNDFNYNFDVEEGILSDGKTKLLTTNIRGLRVLTSKTNTELLTLIDIKAQEYENEQHESQQDEENE
ncbi:Uncharacterized protein CTYZ_00002284 [Cryptosporidium tyzzeri]|nr:Uncharacterized protein CTYZ_00002284 [Cryptosporidium tyzzeri]